MQRPCKANNFFKKKIKKRKKKSRQPQNTPDKPTKKYTPYSCHRNDNTIQPLKSSQLENNPSKTYIKIRRFTIPFHVLSNKGKWYYTNCDLPLNFRVILYPKKSPSKFKDKKIPHFT